MVRRMCDIQFDPNASYKRRKKSALSTSNKQISLFSRSFCQETQSKLRLKQTKYFFTDLSIQGLSQTKTT